MTPGWPQYQVLQPSHRLAPVPTITHDTRLAPVPSITPIFILNCFCISQHRMQPRTDSHAVSPHPELFFHILYNDISHVRKRDDDNKQTNNLNPSHRILAWTRVRGEQWTPSMLSLTLALACWGTTGIPLPTIIDVQWLWWAALIEQVLTTCLSELCLLILMSGCASSL